MSLPGRRSPLLAAAPPALPCLFPAHACPRPCTKHMPTNPDTTTLQFLAGYGDSDDLPGDRRLILDHIQDCSCAYLHQVCWVPACLLIYAGPCVCPWVLSVLALLLKIQPGPGNSCCFENHPRPFSQQPKQEQDPERRAAMHAIRDTRVDVCLYFIPPHRLRQVGVLAGGRLPLQRCRCKVGDGMPAVATSTCFARTTCPSCRRPSNSLSVLPPSPLHPPLTSADRPAVHV